MTRRLNQEREKDLQPTRVASAIESLGQHGLDVTQVSARELRFEWRGATVCFFPYSGWHTGKSINDGRGIMPLLKQLKASEASLIKERVDVL